MDPSARRFGVHLLVAGRVTGVVEGDDKDGRTARVEVTVAIEDARQMLRCLGADASVAAVVLDE